MYVGLPGLDHQAIPAPVLTATRDGDKVPILERDRQIHRQRPQVPGGRREN